MKIPQRRSSKLRRASWVAVALLVVLAGLRIYQADTVDRLAQRDQSVRSAEVAAPEPASRFDQLSETPVRIVIDKIAVDAEIIPVGLTANGLMDDPASNHQVGWYDQSARAGEDKYAMLLDGHFGTDTVPAVFRDLVELDRGDSIKIHGEAGAVLEYQVVETDQRYTEEVDMKRALYPYRDGVQSLTIITCEGQYDPVNVSYDKRTIVYAERII